MYIYIHILYIYIYIYKIYVKPVEHRPEAEHVIDDRVIRVS